MSSRFYRHPLARAESALNRKQKKKRKREDDDEEDDISSSDDARPKSSGSTWAALLPAEAQRRRTAGIAADDAIPQNNFPNRPQDYKPYLAAYQTPSDIREQLAKLKPPLDDHIQQDRQFQTSRSSLKQQHIDVLYNVLQRCLLQKDYARASRTFGLLLRTESLGQLPDLRERNLWGIGAEILLQRRPQSDDTEHPSMSRQKAFGDMKQYFERLIIQFPYRPSKPNTISAVHFHVALFGQWIAFIDDRYKEALQAVRSHSDHSGDGFTFQQLDEIETSRQDALHAAEEVSQRLEEVMRSIPYSDNADLWRLKGNIYLWLDDLSQPHQESASINLSSTGNTEDSALARRNADIAFQRAADLDASGQQRQQVLPEDIEDD